MTTITTPSSLALVPSLVRFRANRTWSGHRHLATHHDHPPSLKASGKRNHDSSIFTRPFSTGSTPSGPSASFFVAMHATDPIPDLLYSSVILALG